MPSADPFPLCADCAESPGTHLIRKRPLCSPCFQRYVTSKILKRMESYRIKNQTDNVKPRLLIPLSGGVSSMALVSILSQQLAKQQSMQGRTAYDLVVVHVDTSPEPPPDDALPVPPACYTTTTMQFPHHTYLPVTHLSQILTLDPSLPAALSHLNLTLPSPPSPSHLPLLLASSTTPSALAHLHKTLLSRLVATLAVQHSCSGILYGHSDSRLASLTLSLVASGHGASVPGAIADGYSPAWGVGQRFPCRDLFRTEVELYAQILAEEADGVGLVLSDGNDGEEGKRKIMNVRDQSIGELLGNYIEGQGERYPSIMANVVRTAGKLDSDESKLRTGEDDGHSLEGREGKEGGNGGLSRYCVFCRGLMLGRERKEEEVLCYGCRRVRGELRPVTLASN
jgi:cytoplasmic tRNA 2-thiolation protein 2